jgi:hypothetical protein
MICNLQSPAHYQGLGTNGALDDPRSQGDSWDELQTRISKMIIAMYEATKQGIRIHRGREDIIIYDREMASTRHLYIDSKHKRGV